MSKTIQEVVEIESLAMKAAGDYVVAKKITQGLSKKAHAGAMLHALTDNGLIEPDSDSQEMAYFILCALENGSQLRQQLEKAGKLGSKVSLADDYIMASAAPTA
jgi:glycosyltransferase involved in cell wall biosynthesis